MLLGGARSGKSALAERMVSAAADGVTRPVYVATAVVDATDADHAARIAAHRARRPAAWTTVDAGADLAGALAMIDPAATVLVDALGSWVAAHPDLVVDVEPVLGALAARRGVTVVVSEEVGLGVHPETPVGRRFRDVLGEVNQAVAAVADDVLLVVAGRVLPLGRWAGEV